MTPMLPLLGLLARGDAYGYELKRIVAREFTTQWRIDFAQLYRSLAKLEAQSFVRVRTAASSGGPTRMVYAITPRGRRAFEKWLQAPASSENEFWVKTRLAAAVGYDAYLPLVIVGSDDPLLAELARMAQAQARVVGSMAGLVALAEEKADVVGAHLREPGTDSYNVSYVQHLVAEQDVLLVNFAIREYGLMVERGNPRKIRGVRDLANKGVRLINRTLGSGARLWLQRHVRDARLDPLSLEGWSSGAPTYDAVGRAIVTGIADAGPGLRSAAERLGLDFVALGQERFDLAMPRVVYESERSVTLREAWHSKEFHRLAGTLVGYDLTQSGRVIAEIKYGLRRRK